MLGQRRLYSKKIIACMLVMLPLFTVFANSVESNILSTNLWSFQNNCFLTFDVDSSSIQSNRGVSADDDLMVHWNFDKNSEPTAYDSSFNNNTGSLYNFSWTTGKYGDAVNFDGKSGYLEEYAPTFLKNSQGTIACWVKLGANANGVLFAASTNGTTSDELYVNFLGSSKSVHVVSLLKNRITLNTYTSIMLLKIQMAFYRYTSNGNSLSYT
jgi:hypothetical protein